MSQTTCPGDSVYELLGRTIPEAVQRLRQVALEEARVELGVEEPPATAEPPPSAEVRTTPSTIGSESVAVGTDGVEPIDVEPAGEALSPATDEADEAAGYLVPAGVTMIVAGLAGLVALRRRRIDG